MDRSNTATVQPIQYALACALMGCCFAPCSGHAAKTAPNPSQASSSETAKSAQGIPFPGPLFADPYPSPPVDPAPDIYPTEESLSRAEAFLQFSLGLTLEAEGRSEAAFPYFLKALELDPGNVGLASKIAADFQRQNRLEEAVRLLKATHQAAPKEARPAIELARIYLSSLRQPDAALTYAERGYKIAPEDYSAISTMVEVCTTARLTQRIEETLRKTLSSTRTDPSFWLKAGDLFRNALSVKGGPPSKTQLERINGLYRRALDLDPNSLTCVERTADHFMLSQQFSEACRFYERTHSLYQEQNKTRSANIIQKWARGLILSDRSEDAVDLLEETLKEVPASSDLRELLGELYLQQGQLVAALSQLRTALDLSPARMEDHVRVIQLQLRLKRGDEASETAARARKLFPEAPGLTMLLAIALGEAKRHQEALVAFESAEREFAEKGTEALDSSFYLTYGAAAERAGLLDQAARLLRKSISLDPDSAAEAMNYLAFMWVDRNMNLDEAGVLVKKALALRPNHPAYLDSLGWWYYQKGDYAAAVKELKKALQKIRREEAPEVYDHLGDAQHKLGDVKEALSAWEAALELDPSLDSVKEKIQRVRSPSQTQNQQ